MKEKILLSWSGGKDSAMALYHVKKSKSFEIISLLTTVTEDYARVSMHGIRKELVESQAISLELPLNQVLISKNRSNQEYESKMRNTLTKYQDEGVSSVIFGDIFLEDIRKYREDKLLGAGMKGIFPLWKKDTKALANSFIDLGFKAVTSCVDSRVLGKEFVGKDFNKEFLSKLPGSVDPCGENGEFHSFVYDGPIFTKPVLCKKGEIVLRDRYFYYCDLLPLS